MANYQKYNRSQVGHLLRHFERAKEDGQYVNFGNQEIDLTRTKYNHNILRIIQPLPQEEFIKKRLKEVNVLNRKDINIMCSVVATLPKEVDVNDRDKVNHFFYHTAGFLLEKHGEENAISGYVHMDEKQPHMHFTFIPVVPDGKGGEKVSAKEAINRTFLRSFHREYQAHLNTNAEHYYNVTSGITKGGNRMVAQLKEITRLDNLIDNKNKELQQKQFALEELERYSHDVWLAGEELKKENKELEERNEGIREKERKADERYQHADGQYNRYHKAKVEYQKARDELYAIADEIQNTKERERIKESIEQNAPVVTLPEDEIADYNQLGM